MENQLTILAESLGKKIQVLSIIQECNKQQEQLFTNEKVDLKDFDEIVEEKGRLIEQLTLLDEGFEILYKKLADQLKNNRQMYTSEIRGLQQQIAQITEMSVAIEAQEKRNHQLVEQFFVKERVGIRQKRQTSKVAYDYYKKVNNTAFVPPQFLDSRK